MSKLKLFISHSSRLDDIDHDHPVDDHNWQLLCDTCKAIRDHYGDRVEVLVDQDGLIQGKDWEQRLNEWLAECNKAIILFSKRAIEKSNWVAKEATILSWRREIDADFELIPVLLDGETTPEDLQKDFFGILRIGDSQFVRNACCAEEILGGVREALGEPAALCGSYPQTPFERIQGGIEHILAKDTTLASLEAAWQAVAGPAEQPDNHPDSKKRYAAGLARQLLRRGVACFKRFENLFDCLEPSPNQERSLLVLKKIRALWVNAGAAGFLPNALHHNECLTMSGELLFHAEPVLGTQHYTIDRYIERAWPRSDLQKVIAVTRYETAQDIQDEIRRQFFGGGPLPPAPVIDQNINHNQKIIVLYLPASEEIGSIPDPRMLNDLSGLKKIYSKLIIILGTGGSAPTALPDSIRLIEPPLDPALEWSAHLAERSAFDSIKRKCT